MGRFALFGDALGKLCSCLYDLDLSENDGKYIPTYCDVSRRSHDQPLDSALENASSRAGSTDPRLGKTVRRRPTQPENSF